MAFGNGKHVVQGGPLTPELVDDLKERNAALELQIKCAKDEIALRESKIQALDRRAKRMEERFEKAEAETRCSDELIDELQVSKNLLADELAQVKFDLESRIMEVQNLEAKLKELEREYEESGDQESTDERVEELKKINAELKARLEEAELRNGDLQNDVDYLVNDVRELEEQLDSSGPNTGEIIQRLEDANADLNDQIQQLESKRSSLEVEVTELRAQQADLQKVEGENRHLFAQLEDLETKCQQLEQELSAAREFQMSLRAEERKNSGLVEELTALEEKCASLEIRHGAAIASKDDRLKVLESENEDLRSSVQQIRDDLQRKSEEVQQLEERCVALAQASRNDDGAKDELLQHIQSSNQKLSDKLAEYETESRVRESEVKCLKRRVLDLEDELSHARELEEENVKLAKALKSAEDKHKDSLTHAEFLELRCNGLEMRTADFDRLKQNMDDLEEQFAISMKQAEETAKQLTENCEALAKELGLSKEVIAKKDEDLQFLRSLEQETAESKQASDQLVEEVLVSNSKLTSLFGEKEEEKRKLEEEIQMLRERCNDLQQSASHENEMLNLKQELERSEKARVSQERQMKFLEEKCARLESLQHEEKTSPRTVLPIRDDVNMSATGSSGTASDCTEKWSKYNQSLDKLASRNDKLQIDLEDTRHRISLISKEISKRFQRHGDTTYLSKYAHLIKKMSYRNDQIQMELNEARAKVISLQDEQRRDDLSFDSSSMLLDRSHTLHELATRHKDIHLELVKSRNKVIVLQKEVRELSNPSLDCQPRQYPGDGRREEQWGAPSRRPTVSRVPNNNARLSPARFDLDGSTTMSETCDGSKFSI